MGLHLVPPLDRPGQTVEFASQDTIDQLAAAIGSKLGYPTPTPTPFEEQHGLEPSRGSNEGNLDAQLGGERKTIRLMLFTEPTPLDLQVAAHPEGSIRAFIQVRPREESTENTQAAATRNFGDWYTLYHGDQGLALEKKVSRPFVDLGTMRVIEKGESASEHFKRREEDDRAKGLLKVPDTEAGELLQAIRDGELMGPVIPHIDIPLTFGGEAAEAQAPTANLPKRLAGRVLRLVGITKR